MIQVPHRNGASKHKLMNISTRWFLVALAASGLLSAAYLNKEFWYDEAYTLKFFVPRGVFGVLTDYHAPNNHMVFTSILAAYLKVCVWFNAPSWVMRLLPWFFSMAAVIVVYVAVARWRGSLAAFWSALLLGTSHFFLAFSCQLRGYSLSALWSSLALLILLPFIEKPRIGRLIAFAAIAILSGGTIFTNLFPMAWLGLWALAELVRAGHQQSRSERLLALACPLCPFASLIWYLWHPQVRIQFFNMVCSVPMGGSPNNMLLLQELSHAILVDTLWLAPLILLGFVRVFAKPFLPAGPSENRTLKTFLFALILPLGVLLVVPLPTRVFFVFLPWWMAALGILVTEGWEFLRTRWTLVGRATLGLVACVALFVPFYREYTFGDRYRAHFAEARPQGVYYQYYQVDFFPSAVIRFLKDEDSRRFCIAFTDAADSNALVLAANLQDFNRLYMAHEAYSRKIFRVALENRWNIFIISYGRVPAHEILQGLLSDRSLPAQLDLARDIGFFKIYQARLGG